MNKREMEFQNYLQQRFFGYVMTYAGIFIIWFSTDLFSKMFFSGLLFWILGMIAVHYTDRELKRIYERSKR